MPNNYYIEPPRIRAMKKLPVDRKFKSVPPVSAEDSSAAVIAGSTI